MTSTTEVTLTHPVVAFADDLHAALDAVQDVPLWSATTADERTALVSLARARARLDALWLRVLAAADRDDVAADSGATSTTAWLAAATTTAQATAYADVRLAAALDRDLGETGTALASGDVDLERARVVATAVQALPADATSADPTCARRAERTLLDLARTHDARTLRRLGRHVLHVIDPEAADRRLGEQLEREERAAARVTFLDLHDNGDGTHGGRFRVPDLHAAALRKILDVLADPGRSPADPARRSRPERRGAALCELIERCPAEALPVSGGVGATVVVLLDHDVLLTGLGTARLDTGERISASLARRLACQAGVIPAVVRRLVDGRSVVLDMGRKRRLHTEHMRIALAIEQDGCTAEHCDRPAGWCHAHHEVPWSAGGATSVSNGRLLCGFHHQRAHSSAYRTERLDDGRVRFHRRT